MNSWRTIAVVLAFGALSARADVSSSASYTMAIEAIEAGGQHSASLAYEHDCIITILSGHSVANVADAMTLGFLAGVNNPPIAMDDLRSHPAGSGVDLQATMLLENDSDPDSDGLSLANVDALSEKGASLTVIGTLIRYTPPQGMTGFDHFNYTIVDENGDVATATVTMAVAPTESSQPLNTVAVTRQSDGRYLVRFVGTINYDEYHIQIAHDLNAPVWQDVTIAKAGSDGVVETLIDLSPFQQTYLRAVVF